MTTQKKRFSPAVSSILITGATGFIGQALCSALLLEGHSLTVVARNIPKANRLFGENVRYVTCMSEIAHSSHFDVVINLAGEPVLGPRWTKQRKALLISSRVNVTDDLVNWISQATQKPRLMISASAIGYYGVRSIDDSSELDEAAPSQAIFMSEILQKWEASARKVEECGVILSIIRLGIVLGNGGALAKMLLPIRCGLGGKIGSGRQVLSWIHIEDVLGAIGHLMTLPERTASGVFNLTAPHAVTQKEFIDCASDILHRPTLISMPQWLLGWALGEQATLLVDGQRVSPRRLLDTQYSFAYSRVGNALQDLVLKY